MPEPDDVNAAVACSVRGHRTRLAWTLDDLAARSGVSKGMLSQVEQARTNPSVATIWPAGHGARRLCRQPGRGAGGAQRPGGGAKEAVTL